ncbi:MAG TPA: RIP metalloprotease RseP [Thermoanaerobaculia bacterium]|nr:RIP metalloprotease RseP [Thermoanaerobaculia bacterium]
MNVILTNLLAFGFALGIIIVVHEAGHLLVAKAFGVRVLTFSIGFGKRLWGFARGGTDYRVSAIPLGGYVRLFGENPDESSGDPGEFLSKPRWQRVLVYLAGPAMNVVLSVVLFAVLFMVGVELPNLPAMPPLIGAVEAGSSAARAGLAKGDLVVKVNGEHVTNWQELSLALITSPDKPVTLLVRRGDRSFPATVTPQRVPHYDVGDHAGLDPVLRPQIRKIEPGKPAERAGLRAGDEIRDVDGRPITETRDFLDAIEKRPGIAMTVGVVRDGKPLQVRVVPALVAGKGRIGAYIGFYQRYPPGQALIESLRYNADIVAETFQVLGKIFRREMSAKGAFAGPIEIAAQSGAAARAGFKYLLNLMGFVSLSIAILNLMPIPILDGGQIFILLVEEVIRRDLSLRVKEVISQVGLVLILMLMVVVVYFDLMKHLPGLLPGS